MRSANCRGCNSHRLFRVYDFGYQPLAGCYPITPESVHPAKRFRLDFTQCEQCSLLQVVNVPPVEEIFHGDYRYSSSTVPGLVRHFSEYAEWLAQHLPPNGRVFEFGCNDGVLLEKLKGLGFICDGIDASDNVAEVARSKGLTVATGFLTEQYVRDLGTTEAYDLVTCSNVLAHIHELQDVIKAVALLLKPGGLFAIEVHNGELIRSQNQFDTIYHEHLTYFTEDTLRITLERCGFVFVSCDSTTMHGGGLRCLVKKQRGREHHMKQDLSFTVEADRRDFISPTIDRCRSQLEELYKTHGPLIGYGAAGRSQMFINLTNSADYFSHIYDDSPYRQNRYIAGTDIQISAFKGEQAECLVVLAWNYADDILQKVGQHFRVAATLLPELKVWQ